MFLVCSPRQEAGGLQGYYGLDRKSDWRGPHNDLRKGLEGRWTPSVIGLTWILSGQRDRCIRPREARSGDDPSTSRKEARKRRQVLKIREPWSHLHGLPHQTTPEARTLKEPVRPPGLEGPCGTYAFQACATADFRGLLWSLVVSCILFFSYRRCLD